MDAEGIWQAVCARVRDQIPDAVWLTTFRDVRPIGFDGRTLALAVDSWLMRERLEQRHGADLLAALRDERGTPDVVLVIEVQTADASTPPLAPDNEPEQHEPSPTSGRSAPDPTTGPSDPGLNARYTFDDFVVGSSNRFAHHAALAVAEAPARSYNPLFVTGGAGLGKTHLLHAIAHYVEQTNGDLTVRYVSTEAFLNEYVDALRTNAMPAFKRRFRDIDVLLIDDIQFMEGKEGLQEEFFHTFNSLHGAGRQIVITSDRPPRAIATLEDRLRSRFEWGLVADVQPPDFETRLAILRHKAGDDGAIPPEVLDFIAGRVTTNIRELEGAVNRVIAFASLNGVPLDLKLATTVLGADLAESERPLTAEKIIEVSADHFGFSIDELVGKQRHRQVVNARQIAMYLARELTDLSYPQIGRAFGNRDHTTVMHANDKITKEMRQNQNTYEQVEKLTGKLRGARR